MIQSRYFSDLSSCLINVSSDDIRIEIPSDVFDKAVNEGKISEQRKKIILRGIFSYEAAKIIAQSGKVEAIKFDATSGEIKTLSSVGISAEIIFALAIWDDYERKVAIDYAILLCLESNAKFFLEFSEKVSRVNISDVSNIKKDFVRVVTSKSLDHVRDEIQVNGSVDAELSDSDSVWSQFLHDLGDMVRIPVNCGEDIYDLTKGRISGKQFLKNTMINIFGSFGAVVTIHTLGAHGLITSLVVNHFGKKGFKEKAKNFLDKFVNEDSDEMLEIFDVELVKSLQGQFLSKHELEILMKEIVNGIDKDLLKDMRVLSSRSKQEDFARNFIVTRLRNEVLWKREFVEMPSTDEWNLGFKRVKKVLEACNLGEEAIARRMVDLLEEKDLDVDALLTMLRIGADKNYEFCLNVLGEFYHFGFFVETDEDKAVDYYKRAISLGKNCDGFFEKKIGDVYQGVGCNRSDYDEAVKWYKEAYHKKILSDKIGYMSNWIEDQEQYGETDYLLFHIGYYYSRKGLHKEAVNWFRIGAEKNYPLCLWHLGWMYHHGCGVNKNNIIAHYYYKRVIDANVSDEYFRHFRLDLSLGASLFCDSSNLKIDFAEILYEMVISGEFGKNNEQFLEKVLNQIVEIDDEKYIPLIAKYYRHLRKYDKAIKWLKIGIDKNLKLERKLFHYLGLAYFYGYSINKDYLKALKYFEKSTENWCYWCCARYIGDIYFEGGYGVSRNYEKAIFWYQNADEVWDKTFRCQKNGLKPPTKPYYETRFYYSNYDFNWRSYSRISNNADDEVDLGGSIWHCKKRLGDIYFKGDNYVSRDYKKAIYWYEGAIAVYKWLRENYILTYDLSEEEDNVLENLQYAKSQI